MAETNSALLDLSQQRQTKTCHRSCRTNQIPALAGRNGKLAGFAINVIIPSGLATTKFDASVNADRGGARCGNCNRGAIDRVADLLRSKLQTRISIRIEIYEIAW